MLPSHAPLDETDAPPPFACIEPCPHSHVRDGSGLESLEIVVAIDAMLESVSFRTSSKVGADFETFCTRAFFTRAYGHRDMPSLRQTTLSVVSEIPRACAASRAA